MSEDLWTQRLHAEAFADDPPCKRCNHAADVHSITPGEPDCSECERLLKEEFWCWGYEPMDSRDRQLDEPSED